MGRYFGTTNLSKKFDVSLYSKAIPHSKELWNMMAHRYKCDNNEFIQTACYDTQIVYKIHDGEYELIHDSNDDTGRELTNEEYAIEEQKQKVGDKTQCGFSHEIINLMEKQSTHYPDFDDNGVCKHCQYQFKQENIEEDKQLNLK